jgi:hypothetical protein
MTTEELRDQGNPRGNYTVMGIMIVIISCILLVGIGYFFYTTIQNMSLTAQCGKKQSQIIGAMVAFESSDKPITPDQFYVGKMMTANAARAATCRKFEIVFASLSIPSFLAKCPASRFPAPKIIPQLVNQDSRWGMAADGAVSYAYDWATPSDSLAARVVLADRDLSAHRNPWATTSVVQACFGDAHVKVMTVTNGSIRKSGALVTEDCDGKPINISVMAGRDDFYSADGDGGDPLTPGAGDPLRAWVK